MIAECRVSYKARYQGLEKLNLGAILNQIDTDSDDVTPGIQNEGSIRIPFSQLVNKYDLYYQSFDFRGLGRPIRIFRTSFHTTTTTVLNANANDVTFSVDPDSTDVYNKYSAGAILRVGGEFMVIKTINKGASWDIEVEERGAHGTAIAAHNVGTVVYVYDVSVPHKVATIEGYDSIPTAPSLLEVEGLFEKFSAKWDWLVSQNERMFFGHYRLYYKKSSGVTKDDDYLEQAQNDVVFTLLNVDNYPDVDSIYYFAVSVVNLFGHESDLSNEVEAKMFASSLPRDDVPVPDVSLVISGRMRLFARARKPTDIDAGLAYANVAECDFEIYRADEGLGNPTTGTPDVNQTLVGGRTDKATPYEYLLGIHAYGHGDYWARAKFRDMDMNEGYWGLNEEGVVLVVSETETSDTAVINVAHIIHDQDVVNVMYGDDHATIWNHLKIYAAVDPPVNIDTSDRAELYIAAVGTAWDEDNGYVGGASPSFAPAMSGGIVMFPTFAWPTHVRSGYSLRMHNQFGWSKFTTPVAFEYFLDPMRWEDVVLNNSPTIASFRIYDATDNPPLIEDPELDGSSVAIDVQLGANNSTTFWVTVQGMNEGSAWPTETVSLHNGIADCFPITGGYEVEISGVSATENQWEGYWLRLGKNFGAHGGEPIQEYEIASNTAGDPFYITVIGGYPVRQTNQPMNNWQIIDAPMWTKVDFHRNIPVDVTGATGNFVALARSYFSMGVPRNMRFRGQAHNSKGRSASTSPLEEWIYAQYGTNGTFIPANATIYRLVGVRGKDSTAGNSGYEVDAEFYVDGNYIKWTAGNLYIQDKTIVIDANITGVEVTQKLWFYYNIVTEDIEYTTSLANIDETIHALLGMGRPGTPGPSFSPFTGGRFTASRENLQANIISANEINVSTLSAISADMGTLTAGKIRLPGTGNARIEIDGLSTPKFIGSWNSSDVQTVKIASDGSGYLGISPNWITWGTDGVVQVPTIILEGDIEAGLLRKDVQNWITTCIFSSSAWDRVDWSTGQMRFSDGDVYDITASFVSSMTSSLYYIVWDPATPTVFSAVTTAPTTEKLVVCIARRANASGDNRRAFYVPAIGQMGLSDVVIQAGSIQSGMIGADVITSVEINAVNLSGIFADMGTLTAGIIRLPAAGNSRIEIDGNTTLKTIRSYNSNNDITANIQSDGSGYLGLGTTRIEWNTSGVVQVPAAGLSGTIVANQLTKGVQKWFHTVQFQADSWQKVSWGAGVIRFADGGEYSIAADAIGTGDMADSTLRYIVWDPEDPTGGLKVLTSNVLGRYTLVCVARRATNTDQRAFFIPAVGVFGINSELLQVNAIQTSHIAAGAVTAAEINVANLEAISANMGTLTAGKIRLPATGNARIEIDGDSATKEIRAYNSSGVKTVSILSDGSGFFGVGGTQISWVIGGTVSTPAAGVTGTLVASQLSKDTQNWSTTCTFSAGTGYRQVDWSSGQMRFVDGSTQNITGSNTGTMSLGELYYIKWNPATPTVFAANLSYPVSGDILVCIAKASSDTTQKAFFIPAVGTFGINSDLLQVNAIQTDHLAADIVTAAKINVAQLSSISVDAGTITAGTLTGTTIRTAASGERIILDNTNRISFYTASGLQSQLKSTDGGQVIRTNPSGEIRDISFTSTLSGSQVFFDIHSINQLVSSLAGPHWLTFTLDKGASTSATLVTRFQHVVGAGAFTALQLSTTSAGVTSVISAGSITPDGTLNLGSAAAPWNNIYASKILSTTDATNTFSIGDASIRWNTLVGRYIYLDFRAAGGLGYAELYNEITASLIINRVGSWNSNTNQARTEYSVSSTAANTRIHTYLNSTTPVMTMAPASITITKELLPSGTINIGASGSRFGTGFFSVLNAESYIEVPAIRSSVSDGGFSYAVGFYTGSTRLGILGLGSNNLYGLQLGDRTSDRGSIFMQRRSITTTMPGVLILESSTGGIMWIWTEGGNLRISGSDPLGNTGTGSVVATV